MFCIYVTQLWKQLPTVVMFGNGTRDHDLLIRFRAVVWNDFWANEPTRQLADNVAHTQCLFIPSQRTLSWKVNDRLHFNRNWSARLTVIHALLAARKWADSYISRENSNESRKIPSLSVGACYSRITAGNSESVSTPAAFRIGHCGSFRFELFKQTVT